MAGRHAYFSNIGFQRGLHGAEMDLHRVPMDCRFVYREAFLQARGYANNTTSPKPPKGNWLLRLIIWLGRKLGFFF